MTTVQVISHWLKGAKDALDAARLLEKDGKYELALFHCHLAVEKVLKAAVMKKTGKPHPKIHELSPLAKLLNNDWNVEDIALFETLSDFAIAARYDDPDWAERFATASNAKMWIERVSAFFSKHYYE